MSIFGVFLGYLLKFCLEKKPNGSSDFLSSQQAGIEHLL